MVFTQDVIENWIAGNHKKRERERETQSKIPKEEENLILLKTLHTELYTFFAAFAILQICHLNALEMHQIVNKANVSVFVRFYSFYFC